MCQADKHTHRNDSRLYSGVCLAPLPRVPRSTRLARIITGLPLIRLQNQQQLFLKARAENRQPMHNTRIIIISAVRPVCVCMYTLGSGQCADTQIFIFQFYCYPAEFADHKMTRTVIKNQLEFPNNTDSTSRMRASGLNNSTVCRSTGVLHIFQALQDEVSQRGLTKSENSIQHSHQWIRF